MPPAAAAPLPTAALPAAVPAVSVERVSFLQAGGLSQVEQSMMKIQNQEVKTQMTRRLARIEGQLRGVQKMISEDRDCRDVMQQLVAIRSAVQSASLSFMQEVAKDCLLNPNSSDPPEQQRELVNELIHLLGKVS